MSELSSFGVRTFVGTFARLLFVNAGVANGASERVDQVTTDEFVRVMVTNALPPMRVIETLGELVLKTA